MEKNRSSKSNTYGYGFADGQEITLGASKNGKIWSRLVGNVQEWIDWCNWIGLKLVDPLINIDAIFQGFLQPKRFVLSQFKELSKPISIDWPNSFYVDVESKQAIFINGVQVDLSDITLSVRAIDDGYIIEMTFPGGTAYLNLIYSEQAFAWKVSSAGETIEYRKNKKTVDFLQFLSSEDCFKIRLIDGTFVENNYHFKPYKEKSTFPLDTEMLTVFSWQGVELNRESMGLQMPLITTSIQYHIFDSKRVNNAYDVIFNDDESGEAADLICFGMYDDQLLIEAIHCKYMLKKDKPGSRLSDFYELCGQAQKNIKSLSNILRLFDHIKSRDMKASKKKGTRFLKGDLRQLELLIKSNSYRRPKFKVTLVQPALAKEKASADVLELIGSTYSLLKETLNSDFEVICSQ